MDRRPTLSLNEWAVLGVLVDQPRHGYDIAAELRPGTQIGDTWKLTRPFVYRALERLEALGLAEPRRTETGGGPPRTIYGPTRRGRSALHAWLVTPVDHLRDIRSSFLLKLALNERLGRDHRPLVHAQRERFEPMLRERLPTPPVSAPAALWRHHSALAADTFLADLLEPQG